MTLPMQGHWGCVRYIYIGSAADRVYGLLIYTNLLCNTDS